MKPSSILETHTLLTGLGFGESPRWHAGRLWFSNWGRQQVVVRVPATIPFSIKRLPAGLGQVLYTDAPAPGAGWP